MQTTRLALLMMLAMGAATGADAQVAGESVVWLPGDIVFKAPPKGPGPETAVLYGDPSKPGVYVVLTKWLAGDHFSRPHWHPNDRFITVIKGTWWVGSGPNFDPANATVPMPAGSVVTHYGRQVHYDGAKDEDAVLLIVGEGPATSTPFVAASETPKK